MSPLEINTATVSAEFEEVTRARGGEIVERYDGDGFMYRRSLGTPPVDVRPGDSTRGGLAIRMRGPQVVVAPYLRRKVCANGAIAMHAVSVWQVRYTDYPTEGVFIEELRKAMHESSRPGVFEEEIEKLRASTEASARESRRGARVRRDGFRRRSDHDLIARRVEQVRRAVAAAGGESVVDPSGLPVSAAARAGSSDSRRVAQKRALARLARLQRERATLPVDSPVEAQIAERFERGPDRSRFSLMNAVTSVARDTRDPELKWNLEALGSAIGAGLFGEQELGLPRASVRESVEQTDWRCVFPAEGSGDLEQREVDPLVAVGR